MSTPTRVMGAPRAEVPVDSPTPSSNVTGSGRGLTMLAALRQSIASRGRKADIFLSTKDLEKDGYSIRFDPNFGWADLDRWRKYATRTVNGLDEIDALDLACYTVVDRCRAILQGQDEIRDSHNVPITFKSQDLQQELGTMTEAATVQKFVGNDFLIIAMGNAITAASGYGENVEAASPLGP